MTDSQPGKKSWNAQQRVDSDSQKTENLTAFPPG